MTEDDDQVDDCEWFDDYWRGLLRVDGSAGLRRADRVLPATVGRSPDDPNAVTDLVEAYVLAGQFEQAIEFAGPYYEADPESFDFQATIWTPWQVWERRGTIFLGNRRRRRCLHVGRRIGRVPSSPAPNAGRDRCSSCTNCFLAALIFCFRRMTCCGNSSRMNASW